MGSQGIDELIALREIEIECHACHAVNLRTLGWMREKHETRCDACGELIVLGTAELRARMRNTERQLRTLGEQLAQQLGGDLAGPSRRS